MGAEKVGIYSAAYGMGSIILMFSTYILYVLRPTVYGLFDKKKVDEVKMYLSYSWKYLLMFSIPSVFGLTLLAKPLLTNLTTTAFISEGEFIVPIVAVSIVYYGVAMIFGVVLLSHKRPKIYASVYSFAAVLNLVLNIIFVPIWGIIGAAVTTFIAYYVLTIVIWYISYKKMKFNIQLGFLAKSIIASVFMSFIIWMVKPTGLMAIIVLIIISTIIYFSFLFLLKGFGKEELIIIRRIIRFRKNYSDQNRANKIPFNKK
jgi:O-antigen/teichoic acid export membrane protein